MFHRSIRVAVLAGTIAAAATGLAVSAVYAEVPATIVRYGDLDLQSSHGQHVLARRISVAADTLCGAAADRLASAACRSAATTQARAQIRTATGQGL